MKEFVTALKAADQEQDESIEFGIDGFTLHAYRPTPAQFAVAMSALGPRRDMATQMAGVIDFFVEVLDTPSQQYITNRLLDRTDPFGLEEVEEILEWMVEEWSGRPTDQPSASTPSASSGGRKSTRTTTRSTSSPSASTGT